MAETGNKQLSIIVGLHHGCCSTGATGNVLGNAYGREAWFPGRQARAVPKNEFDAVWPEHITSSQNLLLAGLTSVTDWLGSVSGFDDPKQNWRESLQAALENAGQIAPQFITHLTFEDLFREKRVNRTIPMKRKPNCKMR
ncbi:HD domain-containing protein [Atlantibacter sp.]|uniref:HD domain-containing protein n=1 Tax=Atlantibacter sp. TaxID=1903473 RepID=UPI0028995C14|nr:hypothetical protein [Atlantibacter sp.]